MEHLKRGYVYRRPLLLLVELDVRYTRKSCFGGDVRIIPVEKADRREQGERIGGDDVSATYQASFGYR
ncbi:hypothetical protein, partial [uncultured Oscillibacter sp.]|uniref:hypothetical protein n=1 Tax=uncultured Oscillibacter sp. TaxID=876091 RepID=UPI0025F15BAB